jgi:hypothetical protein
MVRTKRRTLYRAYSCCSSIVAGGGSGGGILGGVGDQVYIQIEL